MPSENDPRSAWMRDRVESRTSMPCVADGVLTSGQLWAVAAGTGVHGYEISIFIKWVSKATGFTLSAGDWLRDPRRTIFTWRTSFAVELIAVIDSDGRQHPADLIYANKDEDSAAWVLILDSPEFVVTKERRTTNVAGEVSVVETLLEL